MSVGTSQRGSGILLLVPAMAAAASAMRTTFGPGVSICLAVGIILMPVWVGTISKYRGMGWFFTVGALAVVWGGATSFMETERTVSLSLFLTNTFTLLSMLVAAGMLLWSRDELGVGWTVMWFGVGALANVAIAGPNPANPWKYSLALPVTLLLLGFTSKLWARRGELVSLIMVAGISSISDSRSFTSFLLIAAAAVLWQFRRPSSTSRRRPWQAIVGLVLLVAGAYFLFQSLLLDGVLGQAAQQRSQAQIDTSGSLITGGRPEMGAAFALVTEHPLGYGSGTLPIPSDVWIAKSGMSELNYNPNNKYVEVFLFGGHYEVHSVVGDLWIMFGPLGALLVLFIVGYGVYSTAGALTTRTASAALVLLTALGAWDMLFSPWLTSYRTLSLLIALAALPAMDRRAATAAAKADDVGYFR